MQIYEARTNTMIKDVAKKIKSMKAKGVGNEAISEAIGRPKNDITYVCYHAALALKEDHSCAPWSIIK